MTIRNTPEQPFQNFECFDLTDPCQVGRLSQAIAPEFILTRPYRYVVEAILKRAVYSDCQGAILEKEYVDRDFLRGYLSLEGRAFTDTPRFTKRIHFFSVPVTEDQLVDLESLVNHYIGATVIRPTKIQNIGRTILSPPRLNEECYFPTLAKHDAHLFGTTFSIPATVFMEQDCLVAACATVAIWMSTFNLSKRFGLDTPALSTSEITLEATSNVIFKRALPSDGLHNFQMSEALRSMGYEPLYFEIRAWETVQRIMFGYVTSGISPILGIDLWEHEDEGGGHAITPIGYTLDHFRNPTSPYSIVSTPKVEYFGVNQWVSSFFANDDQQGPFQRLVHVSETFDGSQIADDQIIKKVSTQQPDLAARYIADHQAIEAELKAWLANKPWIKVGTQFASVTDILVPHPPRVPLISMDAEKKALYVLLRFLDSRKLPTPSDLVLRTDLMPSVTYHQLVKASSTISPNIKNLYLSKPMPRWIWVIEISSKSMMEKPTSEERLISGEVILDATSNKHVPDFLAIHYVDTTDSPPHTGYIATMMRQDSTVADAMSVQADFPDELYVSITSGQS